LHGILTVLEHYQKYNQKAPENKKALVQNKTTKIKLLLHGPH